MKEPPSSQTTDTIVPFVRKGHKRLNLKSAALIRSDGVAPTQVKVNPRLNKSVQRNPSARISSAGYPLRKSQPVIPHSSAPTQETSSSLLSRQSIQKKVIN